MAEMRIARSELILGAPGSGKTARAEALAQAWLARSPQHRAVCIATDEAGDEQTRRIFERRMPGRGEAPLRLASMDDPRELAHAIGPHSRPDTLIVAHCLTLWLTAQLMPAVLQPSPNPNPRPKGEGAAPADSLSSTIANALRYCAGPIVLISNEPGLEDVAASHDQRIFWDSLGDMNREAAAACERVTLMSAGRALTLKGSA
jgi:adenosylcobinamide kinase / adenosylcobinamide-phosphate guanylyltransferase